MADSNDGARPRWCKGGGDRAWAAAERTGDAAERTGDAAERTSDAAERPGNVGGIARHADERPVDTDEGSLALDDWNDVGDDAADGASHTTEDGHDRSSTNGDEIGTTDGGHDGDDARSPDDDHRSGSQDAESPNDDRTGSPDDNQTGSPTAESPSVDRTGSQEVDRSGSPTEDRGETTLMESYTEMTEVLLPNDTNNLGRALGGVVLHWMDMCAAVAAMRFSRRQCVTAAMDHVDFISPIDQGEVAIIEAYVFATGTTSIDVKVNVRAEDPRSGEERETTTSYFTFVALDETGSPTPVPDLACPTENQAVLRDEAIEGRQRQLRSIADRLE